jgi:hypothetical protein
MIDIVHYIYEEICLAILERKCCILAPYIQLLIEDALGTLANRYPRIDHKLLTVSIPLVEEAPNHTIATYAPSSSRGAALDNGWKAKLNKVFYLNIDIQHQNYKIHRSNKLIRQNQKKQMRQQGMHVSSGSEDVITDEKNWKSKNSTWEDDDTSSLFVPPRGDEDPEDDS